MEKSNMKKVLEIKSKVEKISQDDDFDNHYKWYKEYWGDLNPVIREMKDAGNFFFNLNNNLLDILTENSGNVEKLKDFRNELEESINSLGKHGMKLRNMVQQIIES